MDVPAFPAYDDYQESGIPWIRSIPKDWEITKAKWIFKKMERPVRPEDDVVTAFRDGEVTLRKNRRTEGFTNALKEHGYQGIRKGDLIIHAMDAFAGSIGVSDSDGKSTPVYSVCVPKGRFPANTKYYAYLLRYMALSGYIESLAKGIRERSTDFRFNDFANLLLPNPTDQEQTRIVAFLDEKTAEIDAAITKKQQLIQLLNEQKAILINRAVTKGLNPDVKMKDSGVPWIGDIPAHWAFPAFKHCCSLIKDGLHHTPQKYGTGINFISTQHVRDRKISIENATYISEHDFKAGHPRIRPQVGDVLITLVGSIGFAAEIRKEHVPLSFTRHVGYVRLKKDVLDAEYLINYTESYIFKCFIDKNISKTAQPSIYLSSLASHKLPVPPKNERQKICDWLKCELKPFSDSIELIEKEIERLRELRQVLIAEATTGKIKV